MNLAQKTSQASIQQDFCPVDCKNHRFGLPVERWESLAGQAFWITGAGTGYGQAIAIALATAGAKVFLTGRRATKLEDTRQKAVRAGANIENLIAVTADISDPASVTVAARTIAKQCGILRGLVCNAALPQPRSSPKPLADLSVEEWDELLKTNITGQWLVARAALPMMSAEDGYRIVLMSSEAGWAFTPGFGPYNLTKAAVNNLGASLAAELTNNGADSDHLPPLLAAVRDTVGADAAQVLADAGFRSEAVFEQLKDHPTELIVALGRERKRPVAIDAHKRPRTAAMAEKFKSEETQTAYRHRKWLSEPPNGWIKSVLGFCQLSMRGLAKAKAEWRLVCAALNLRRMATLAPG